MSARRTRLNRAVAWAVVLPCILAPLLALGLLAQVTLTYKPLPVRTGDALTDSYLQALVDNDLVTNEAVQWQAFAFSSIPRERQRDLPESTWHELEQRFGNTPDYWLLCHTSRPVRKQYLSPVAGVKLWDSRSYLEQARLRGVADWRVYYWLSRNYSFSWEEEADSALGISCPKNKAPLEEYFAYCTRRNAEVLRRHGSARRELFAALAQAGANQAQAQYELAFRTFEDGDLPGALSHIAAGNAAPHNSFGFGPPLDKLLAAAAQGQPLAGDRILTGRLKQDYYGVPAPDFSRTKRMVKYLSRWAAERRDATALTVLHRFNCRKGTAAGADDYQALGGVVGETELLRAYRNAQPQLSTAQVQRCSDISLELGKIRSEMKLIPRPSFGSVSTSRPAGWLGFLADLKWLSDGGRSAVVNDLEQSCAELLARQSATAKVQARLERFAPPLPWEQEKYR